MKVATFNLNGVNGRLDLLLKWLAAAQPRRRLPAGVEGGSEVDRKTRRTAFALTSVRGHLIALVSGLAALLFAATCFIVVYTFEQNREDFQDRLLAASKAVSAATDRQLVQAAATAVTLSRDPDLQNARWARFHHRARDLDLALPGWLMVEDDAGGVVLDSQLPLGTALAPRAPVEGRVADLGRLAVTVTGVRFAKRRPPRCLTIACVSSHAPRIRRVSPGSPRQPTCARASPFRRRASPKVSPSMGRTRHGRVLSFARDRLDLPRRRRGNGLNRSNDPGGRGDNRRLLGVVRSGPESLPRPFPQDRQADVGPCPERCSSAWRR